jgi:hypothetical protein
MTKPALHGCPLGALLRLARITLPICGPEDFPTWAIPIRLKLAENMIGEISARSWTLIRTFGIGVVEYRSPRLSFVGFSSCTEYRRTFLSIAFSGENVP